MPFLLISTADLCWELDNSKELPHFNHFPTLIWKKMTKEKQPDVAEICMNHPTVLHESRYSWQDIEINLS